MNKQNVMISESKTRISNLEQSNKEKDSIKNLLLHLLEKLMTFYSDNKDVQSGVSSGCFQCTKHYEFGKDCTNILDEFTTQVLKIENNDNDTIKVELLKLRSENDNLKMQIGTFKFRVFNHV